MVIFFVTFLGREYLLGGSSVANWPPFSNTDAWWQSTCLLLFLTPQIMLLSMYNCKSFLRLLFALNVPLYLGTINVCFINQKIGISPSPNQSSQNPRWGSKGLTKEQVWWAICPYGGGQLHVLLGQHYFFFWCKISFLLILFWVGRRHFNSQ